MVRRKAMIQIMPASGGKIIGVKPSGKLTDRDYQEVLIPTLEALIKQRRCRSRVVSGTLL
jgi:hypothetical protein